MNRLISCSRRRNCPRLGRRGRSFGAVTVMTARSCQGLASQRQSGRP
jgi:hypothetical protein